MNGEHLPGSQWLAWIRNFTLRIGVLTGVFLNAVMVVSILAATRVPFLEPFANLRNWTARAAFTFVMLFPVMCFLRAPVRLFAAGMCGWSMLAVGYALMGVFFGNLHSRLNVTPFHLFIVGTAMYGLAAVAAWVLGMALSLRHQPVAAPRRRP